MILNKIRELEQAACKFIRLRKGAKIAKLELKTITAKYELMQLQFEEFDTKIDGLLGVISGAQQMLTIKWVRIQLPAFSRNLGI